jgi:hypothetical protein
VYFLIFGIALSAFIQMPSVIFSRTIMKWSDVGRHIERRSLKQNGRKVYTASWLILRGIVVLGVDVEIEDPPNTVRLKCGHCYLMCCGMIPNECLTLPGRMKSGSDATKKTDTRLIAIETSQAGSLYATSQEFLGHCSFCPRI